MLTIERWVPESSPPKPVTPPHRRHSAWLGLTLCLLTTAAQAAACHVISVSDGDTLKARCPEGMVVVRLAEIDAPEKNQPFGRRARRHLAELCLGQPAEIAGQAIDRYGRTVARVSCQGEDASRAQLRQGLAWVYDRYVRDPGLYDIQSAARQQRLGLWADRSPVAPWLWRKLGQSATSVAR